PPGRTIEEEKIEDKANRPGKYIRVNEGDDDKDGIIDWADLNTPAAQVKFVPIVLELKAPLDLTKAQVKFTYLGSHPDPAGLKLNAAGEYDLPAGDLRIWRNNNGQRNWWTPDVKKGGAAGDYVAPATVYTPAQLGITGVAGPNEREVQLWVEAVRPSAA